ncbi:MAG: hypothetical protein VXW15_06680 [Bdellovibrionota bacterium]|nr:hypothetical protein [Bdellovibrionota bacterium]
MVRVFLIFSFVLSFITEGFSNAIVDPLGEKSDMVLIKDRARTTSMIKKGHGFFEVKGLFDSEKGEEYQIDYSFKINVSFYGDRGGVITLMVPKSYFGDSFWGQVRRGVVETSNLKIKLEDIKERVEHNGITYEECPVLKIYDVKGKDEKNLKDLIAFRALELGILNEKNLSSEEVQDLEASIVTHSSVPALGVIKMNITGKVRNYKIKMGFDLK